MSGIVNIAEFYEHDGIVVIDKNDNVWLTYVCSWWDILGVIRWYLTPGKRAWLLLNTKAGKVRVKAVRLAHSYVRIG